MALEQDMMTVGKKRVQRALAKAREKRNMLGVRPYRSLMTEWIGPVTDGILAWFDAVKKSKGGPKPIALPMLSQLDPEVAAAVSLKAILRMLGIEQRGLIAIAREIGTSCEHEARFKLWEEEDPADWRKLQQGFRDRGSTQPHQRRSTISVWNKHVSDRMPWIDWAEEERYRVGLELINIVVTSTRRFTVMPDPTWVPKKLRTGAPQKRPIILMPDPDLLSWLDTKMDDELVHQPAWMPTVMPPQKWDGVRGGGYWTHFVKTPPLITFKAYHEEVRQVALSEYDALDMGGTFDAINYIQETPWAINKRVLEVAEKVWEQDLALAGIPARSKETIPAQRGEPGTDEYKAWAREASETHARNARMVTDGLTTYRTIQLAKRMSDEQAFYFPHRLDFRGRTYPIPVDLMPQGWDLHRGLLTFAKGKPVGQHDEQWLAIHLANCCGHDKVSYGERIAWVTSRNAQWRRIAEDPFADRSWAVEFADESPWQILAAVFEWVRFLDEGFGMISSLPIRLDGTCNGIQHLSAMVRDENGGRSVNLVPGNQPRDIYQEVADVVTEMLKDKAGNEYARGWLALFDNRVPRSVTKRPVMILPYGGTQHAYFQYTLEWLKKHDQRHEGFDREDQVKAVQYLVPILWEAVGKTVKRAKEVQDWLQACAKIAASKGKPIYWRTPAGFLVRHFYATEKSVRVRTRIDGQSFLLQVYKETKELDQQAQVRGIAPNFVHSMDASSLMSCALLCRDNGVECMTVIHDSYGTVAGDVFTLTECLREAFVQTYSEPVLENYLEACKEAAGDDTIQWPTMPKFGNLDIEQIRQSDYFFA